MRIAVIGAGLTGLTAAHRLSREGHACDVYERWPGLGGQAATIDLGGVVLERYYHHLFTSDVAIAALYRELGFEDAIEWIDSSVSIFRDGASHPFTSPLDLLRFTPLSLRSRLRVGLAALRLQRRYPEVGPLEGLTAREWVLDQMGAEAWDVVWGPLLRGKFGDHADSISMAWLWARLTVRRRMAGKQAAREVLGYPRGGWQPLLDRLAARIGEAGGRVLIDRPAAAIATAGSGFTVTAGAPDSFRRGHDPDEFEPSGESEAYDAVIATVPNPTFHALLDPALKRSLAPGYTERLDGIAYDSALCALLEIDRGFSPYYWTNIADPGIPFIGLVEQTNLIAPEHYGGRRFLYVANYVAPGDPLLALDPDELLDAYEPGLRRVNPGYRRSWVRERWVFREPDAQPIVTVGYRERMPPLATGVPGLLLANTTQVYPEDRGTNYAVALGERVAAELLGR